MCCYNNGICDLCRNFQYNLLQNILKTFPCAATKIESGEFHIQDDMSSLYPPSPPEAKPSRAELASDLLQQLENQCKQDEDVGYIYGSRSQYVPRKKTMARKAYNAKRLWR